MIAIDELNLMSSFYLNPAISDMNQDQKKNCKYIFAFIASLMLEYTINEEKLALSTVEKAAEYKKTNGMINKIFSDEYKAETKKIVDILKDTMNKIIKFHSKQSNNAWKVSNKDAQNILNATIEGKTYSDRIWDNKNKVAKVLKKQIKYFIDGKTSVNEIKSIIQSKFNANTFNTDRLVENEISRVCRELDEKYFEENKDNIYELVYTATLCNTCEKCLEKHGNTYKVDDKNRPKLPQHIRCKCFYAIADDENKINESEANNKKPLVIDLQLFSYIKDRNNVINLVNQGMIDENKFNEFRSSLNYIFRKGIKTPIKIVNNSTDRAYHIAFKHRNLMNELGIKRIEETLKNPDLIKEAIDINGSQNDGYIKNFNGKTLLVIAKDDIITAYYPSINYMKNKIDGWNIIWVKK